MRNIILYDTPEIHTGLLPFTFTRPSSEIRLGIMTIAEKWKHALNCKCSYHVPDYLAIKFPVTEVDPETDIYVPGNVCPTEELTDVLTNAKSGTAFTYSGREVARIGKAEATATVELTTKPLIIDTLPDIFQLNHDALIADYYMITKGRTSHVEPDNSNIIIGDMYDSDGRPLLFIEEGAEVSGAMINLKHGPIYVGRNAEIMEGTCLRGPIALLDNSHINMGTKVYGATTIGPWCKVGGELNNVVFIGFSNKAHDGFLGNAVIGEWCNLGADTVASNLKNDYSEIRLWNYATRRFARTGLQFCGLMMGDHSKAGINTMFNTATIVGVGCNIHGDGFARPYIPSFSEGGASGLTENPLKKCLETARRVMARRHVELAQTDIDILTTVHSFGL